MPIDNIDVFVAKSSVRCIAYVKDDDDALVDPTASIKVTLYNPAGEKQLLDDPNYEIDMEYVEKGVYEYYYQTDSDTDKGYWRGEVEVIDGEGEGVKTSMGNFSFRIK